MDLSARSVLRADRPEAALKRVLALARRRFAGCDGAGVTLIRSGRLMAVASTADFARALDSAQCRAGAGPCLDAIGQLQVFNVSVLTEARSWPRFRAAAEAHGILSTLSAPLTVGGDAIGALNLYGRRAHAFTGCEAEAVLLGTHAAATVAAGLADFRTRLGGRTETV